MYRVRKWITCLTLTLITAFTFFYAASALALGSDSKEKLYIISDSTIYNYKTGVNIYEGHVKVDQGSSHITADRLVTKNNSQHKLQEAIAYGMEQLAHYWTIPEAGKQDVHAHAKIIKFYPLTSNVTLEKNVIVTQGENSFQGELILYNKSDQTITVPASQQGRAVLVYDPNK